MPSPKIKISRSRRGMRRSHNALKAQPVHGCKNCGALMKPHHACGSCGYYNKREVIPQKDLN